MYVNGHRDSKAHRPSDWTLYRRRGFTAYFNDASGYFYSARDVSLSSRARAMMISFYRFLERTKWKVYGACLDDGLADGFTAGRIKIIRGWRVGIFSRLEFLICQGAVFDLKC